MSTSPEPSPLDYDVSRWPSLPRLQGVFVTATDTEVGKTMIAGAIARSLHNAGKRVGVFKPAASGCIERGGQLISTDAEFLAAASLTQQPLSQITPQRFAEPLAPNIAATRAGTSVDLGAIFNACRQMEHNCDLAVVEGVGGLLCPISDDFWVIHLAKLLDLPVVIVARAGLGTINHTLLTLQVARQAGLRVAGVVINRYPAASPDVSIESNPEQIERLGETKILSIVQDDPDSNVEKGMLGNRTLQAINQVDWLTFCKKM